MTYVVLNGVTGLVKLATRGRLIPADYEQREYWTCETHHFPYPIPELVRLGKRKEC